MKYLAKATKPRRSQPLYMLGVAVVFLFNEPNNIHEIDKELLDTLITQFEKPVVGNATVIET